MHFFNSEDSHLVIDKLKQELDDRTSEFRDFPEEDDDPIFESEETGTLLWQRWRIIFSFSFPFLEEKFKKMGDQ